MQIGPSEGARSLRHIKCSQGALPQRKALSCNFISACKNGSLKKGILINPFSGPRDCQDIAEARILAVDVEYAHYRRWNSTLIVKHAAEVCIVDARQTVVLHSYCQPGVSRDKSYSWVGGVKQHQISSARSLEDVSQQIKAAIAGSILVGQGLANDLQALQVSHPIHLMRDTLKYRKFQRKSGEAHSLKYLAQKYLGLDIHQQGQSHLARLDAAVTMELYVKHILTDTSQLEGVEDMVSAYLLLQQLESPGMGSK